jgi:ABC-2 type transport system ATP-binding protein
MILNIKNATLLHGKEKGIQNFDFQLKRGEVAVILGPNGAGKTTLMELMLGYNKLQTGEIEYFEGLTLGTSREKILQRVSFIGDKSALIHEYSIDEMIGLIKGYYLFWDQSYCDELLRRFHLEKATVVKNLSRGMKAKLSLILALSSRPELLIMDESTSGLDPKARDEVLQLLIDFVSSGTNSVLFATHLLEEANAVASRLVFLDQSRKVMELGMDELESGFVVFDDALRFDSQSCSESRLRKIGAGALVIDCRNEKELAEHLLKSGARRPVLKELYMAYMGEGEENYGA